MHSQCISRDGANRTREERAVLDEDGSEPELESSIRRIVRRVMRQERPTSLLARQILSAAKRIRQDVDADAQLDREELVSLVSRRIYELIRPTPPGERTAHTRLFESTVQFQLLESLSA